MAKEQGLTFCRQTKKGVGRAARTSNKYCGICEMHIRGENHEQGTQHIRKMSAV